MKALSQTNALIVMVIFSVVICVSARSWWFSKHSPLEKLNSEQIQDMLKSELPKGSGKNKVRLWLYSKHLGVDCGDFYDEYWYATVNSTQKQSIHFTFGKEGTLLFCNVDGYLHGCPPTTPPLTPASS